MIHSLKFTVIVWCICSSIGFCAKESLTQTEYRKKAIEIIMETVEKGQDVNVLNEHGWTPLVYAVDSQNIDLSKLLIEHGADVNFLSAYHWSPLMYAIKRNNFDIANLLVENGADLDEYNDVGKTPLLMAVERKQGTIVKLLLENGAFTYDMDNKGKTVLDYAAKNNDLGMLGTLIQGGVNPDIVNKDGYTCFQHNVINYYTGNRSVLEPLVELGANPSIPSVTDLIDVLYYEKKMGNTDTVKQLLEMGVVVDVWRIGPPPFVPDQFISKDTWDNPEVKFTGEFEAFLKQYIDDGKDWRFTDEAGNTFLHWVAENGKPNWVEWAIQQGMDVNVQSNFGKTPLHRAAKVFECEPSMRVLLEYDADVEAQDFMGNTPLHYALKENKTKAVEMLLAKNASINTTNAYGMTPLHYVSGRNGTNEARLVQSMLMSGADPTVRDFKGETLVHMLCRDFEDFPEVLQDVIRKGGDVNQPNKMGEYPLHIACRHNNLTMILIQSGADLEIRNRSGMTPLAYAIQEKRTTTVKTLIEAGADVNASTYMGWRPLHYAAWADSPKYIQLLIDNGGNLTAKTFDKETPMDIAKQHKKIRAATFLRDQKSGQSPTVSANEINESESAKPFNKEKAIRENIEQKKKMKQADEQRVLGDWLYSCQDDLLATAVLESDPNAVKKAIQGGEDVNRYCRILHSYRYTPLYMATRWRNEQMVRLLVELGADVNLGNQRTGECPLHLAAWYGYLPMTELLIELGADMNLTNNSEQTPFVTAVLRCKRNIVTFYQDKGFDINTTDKHGNTLLHNGVQWSSTVKFLLEQGLDANAKTKAGRTALHNYMLTAGKDTAAVPKLLVKYGADVNAADLSGNTPLCEALAHDKLETAKFLIESGADVNSGTSGWRRNGPPIHLTKGHIDMIALLLNHGADIKSLNTKGQNLVHSLVNNHSGGVDDKSALDYFIEQGIDINTKDNEEKTPLFYAIERKRIDMVEVLIERGADIEATDSHGRTPLWYAAIDKNPFIVKTLLQNGAETDVTDKYGTSLKEKLQSPLYSDILEIIESNV